MAISFVAAAARNATSTGSSFTFDKPSGIASGDLLIGMVVIYPGNGGTVSFTAPSGWTLIRTHRADSSPSGYPCQIATYYKVATGSEPSTWAGSISPSKSEPSVCAVSAYRGVQSVLASGTSGAGTVSSFSTATVNNTVSGSWRVVAAGYLSTSLASNITANETSRRAIDGAADGTDAIQAAIWDSNTNISTGNTSRTISRSQLWDSAASVIVLLQESTGTPASGSFATTLGEVSSSSAGEVNNPASMAATLPSLSSSFAGHGAPIAADGTMGASLSMLAVDISVSTEPQGVLDTLIPIAVNIVGETVPHGVRVIKVEAEDRTIEVPSRGVES